MLNLKVKRALLWCSEMYYDRPTQPMACRQHNTQCYIALGDIENELSVNPFLSKVEMKLQRNYENL